MLLTVINNTTMHAVATVDDMSVAVAWAETIPYQNDFSIIGHRAECLGAYNPIELYQLHRSLTDDGPIKGGLARVELVPLVLQALSRHPITSDLPPDAKRVAPLVNEENDMAAKKKATSEKKSTVKKAPAKKAPAKRAAVPLSERERQNGILRPLPDSKAGRCWAIADALAKKAGEPPKRADVINACVEAGLNRAGSSADYQMWRKFHGLVNSNA